MGTSIAICFNVPELDSGGWKDKEICKKYPGSGWAPYLKEYANKKGIQVYSGSEAWFLGIKDCLVIQEEKNLTGIALMTYRSAKPWILICFESPLFTPFFYDDLDKIKSEFKYQILFSGGTHRMYFPSFDLNDLSEPEPWVPRKKVCAVMSNKHYSHYVEMFKTSPSFLTAIGNQLHDARYQTIEYFKKNEKDFDLYGKGWPVGYGREISAGNKNKVIRYYNMCVCYENIQMRGYVTEKIIDCFVSGVVPLYIGAPDIHDYVPEGTFLDYRDMKARYVDDASEMLKLAQHFLESKDGRKFSYQGFAENIMELVS